MQKNPRIQNFSERVQKARYQNKENLKQILRDNQNTDYGKKYRFVNIRNEEDYQESVPLTQYDTYKGMREEPKKFTCYQPRCILTTSGTTGMQKEFVLTEEALDRYSSYIYEMPYTLFGGEDRIHLHMSIFRPATNGNTLLSSAYFTWLKEKKRFQSNRFVGGEQLLFSESVGDIAYVKSWLAISEPELFSIQAIFLYDILLLFGYLEEKGKFLLADIKAGKCSVDLPEQVEKYLMLHRPDRVRIQQLEEIFEKKDDEPIAKKLWKNLRFISGIGGKMYEVQEKALKKYTGTIPIYYFAHASSECMMGIAIKRDIPEYVLLPDSAYYEFLEENGKTVRLEEIEIGKKYELIVTTFSGLYRYQTGDMIEIMDFYGEAPVYRVCGRKNNVLNIAGEKIEESEILEVLKRWSRTVSCEVEDFAIGIDSSCIPERYLLFAEIKQKKQKQTDDISLDVMENDLDAILGEVSADYQDIRKLKMLKKPKIVPMKRGEIAELFQDKNRFAHRKPKIFLDAAHTQTLLWKREIGKEGYRKDS